jgi:hypothetical protein
MTVGWVALDHPSYGHLFLEICYNADRTRELARIRAPWIRWRYSPGGGGVRIPIPVRYRGS